jgi:peptide/nickel transport system substrate-binding protein
MASSNLLEIPPYWALGQIRNNPDLRLAYRTKLHTMFFGLDQGSPELRSSNIKGCNPFKDKRVRQAMAHAMDLEPVLTPLMGEVFIPAGMIVAPGMTAMRRTWISRLFSTLRKLSPLLVEAGYPDGFSVTLDCVNECGKDEIATCEGVAEQLGAVGIEVAINWLSQDELYEKVYTDRQSDFQIDGKHMDPDSEGVLREIFQSQSYLNATGYTNPRLDELLDKMKGEMVTYARDAYPEEAWRIVTDDLVYLAIRHGVSVFALHKDLEIPPDPWDVPRFRLARFMVPSGK